MPPDITAWVIMIVVWSLAAVSILAGRLVDNRRLNRFRDFLARFDVRREERIRGGEAWKP